MKYHYADNGWTVIVDENINDLSTEDILRVGRLIVSNMVVVFKKQKLTTEDELRFCWIIGNVQLTEYDRTKHISLVDGILRVTGKKNDAGEPGLFGHTSALDWHSNQASSKNRMPLIWLYGLEGTKGSRTSWINMIEACKDLSVEDRMELRNKKAYFGYEDGKYSTSRFFHNHVNKDNLFPFVMENAGGYEGLYFPFLQMFGMENTSQKDFNEIMERTIAHVTQEKYTYHHDWDDGDVVLSEQWLSIHKRWAFEDMEKRVLHRIAFDYSNIYGVQDDESVV